MASSRQQSGYQGHQGAYQVLNVHQAAAGQIPPRPRPRDQPQGRDQGLGLGLPQPRQRVVHVQDPGARGQEMGPMRLGASARAQANGHHGPGDSGQAHNGQRQGSGGGVSAADPAVKAQVELAMRGLGGLGTRKRGTIIGAIAASGGNSLIYPTSLMSKQRFVMLVHIEAKHSFLFIVL